MTQPWDASAAPRERLEFTVRRGICSSCCHDRTLTQGSQKREGPFWLQVSETSHTVSGLWGFWEHREAELHGSERKLTLWGTRSRDMRKDLGVGTTFKGTLPVIYFCQLGPTF